MRLYQLELRNFKGIQSANFIFAGKSADIVGANGSGKSTLHTALLWLLTGKDAAGRSDYQIKPLGADGTPKSHAAASEVCGTFLLDSGRNVRLSRVLREKWVKKQGTTEQNYIGDETRCTVDDVPKSIGEYVKAVDALCPENLVRLLTDVTYFTEDKKCDLKQRRSMLFDAFGDLTDADVFAKTPALMDLQQLLDGRTVEDYAAICKEQKRRFAQELTEIPVRIDEASKQLRPDIDAKSVQTQMDAATQRLHEIYGQIRTLEQDDFIVSSDEKIRSARYAMENITQERNRVINRLCDAESEAKRGAIRLAQMAADTAEKESSAAQKRLDAARCTLEQSKKIYAQLKMDYVEKSTATFVPKEICETCGQAIPESAIENARGTFNEAKSAALAAITRQGNTAKELLDQNELALQAAVQTSTLAAQKKKIASNHLCAAQEALTRSSDFSRAREVRALDAKIEQAKNDISDYEREKQSAPEQRAQAVQTEIDKLREAAEQTQIDIEKLQMTVLLARKSEETLATIAGYEATKNSLQKQYETAQRGADLCDQFIREKIALVECNINTHFKLVKWKLFEEQKNGGVRQICEACVSGVPYGSLNTAARIAAGVDIVCAFSAQSNQMMPLFIDNRESVTQLDAPETMQIINLVVKPDTVLTMQLHEKE